MKLSINFEPTEKETTAVAETVGKIYDSAIKANVEGLKLGLGFLGQLAEATRDLAVKAIEADMSAKSTRPVRELRDVLRQVEESEDLTDGGVRVAIRGDGMEISAENANFADARTLELTERLHKLEESMESVLERADARTLELLAESERNTESLIQEALEHPDHGARPRPRKSARTDNGS